MIGNAGHAWFRRGRTWGPQALLWSALWTTLALGAWWLWPARFGGSTSMIIVEGRSMEPTYSSGDLVIARAEHRYVPGQVVVVRVTPPGDGSPPALVVHRLLDVASDGHITTRGDNRALADGFSLTTADIVGRADARIPGGGTVLVVLSRWWMLALFAGSLTTVMLWPQGTRITEPTGGL